MGTGSRKSKDRRQQRWSTTSGVWSAVNAGGWRWMEEGKSEPTGAGEKLHTSPPEVPRPVAMGGNFEGARLGILIRGGRTAKTPAIWSLYDLSLRETIYSVTRWQSMPGWPEQYWPPLQNPTLAVYKIVPCDNQWDCQAVPYDRKLLLSEPAVQAALAKCWTDLRVSRQRATLEDLYRRTKDLAIHRDFWMTLHPDLLEQLKASVSPDLADDD